MNPLQGGWFIGLTFLVAATLSVAHLPEGRPDWIGWVRPAWVPLILFFWTLERPHRVGLITVWTFGLLLDVLLSEPLGLNGLLLTLMALLGKSFYERLRMTKGLQQALVLAALVLLIGLAKDVAVLGTQGTPVSIQPVTAAAVTVLLWLLLAQPLRWLAWRAGTA